MAAFDQVTNGKVTVHPVDDLHETTVANATLTAGQPVKAGAAGTIQLFVVGTDPQPAFLGICTVGNLARWQGY